MDNFGGPTGGHDSGPMDQKPDAPETGTPAQGWSAPPPVTAGPAGFVYADVPNRAIAYIIDSILVGIVVGIVGSILGGIGLSPVTLTPGAINFEINFVGLIVSAIVGAAISGAYFVYTWTSMRGTLGMKVLNMQIGNAVDGKTITMDQAVRRWLVIVLPGLLAQVLFVLPAIGTLLGLVAFGWFIYLIWTTAKSPTKQGFHDVFANTMVVKAARNAG